jgi:phospholipid/cholesterol/gamma-HCH transport system permease protein
MAAPAAETASVERAPEALVLRGRLDAANAGRLWREALRLAREPRSPLLVVDAHRVEYCDGGGAALLVALRSDQEAGGGRFELHGLREELREVLALVEPPQGVAAARRPRRGFFESLGHRSASVVEDGRAFVVYVGQLTVEVGRALRAPRRVRFGDVMRTAEDAGIGAIPIMVGIGFLLGLILAFQSAIPMQRFGAQIFVADLLGIAMLRELGPLMASILLTARSGSAFAAEIGTMKVNEEVDALTTMGLEPVHFLVLPRVLAAVLVVPALAMLVNLAGLAGGAVMFLVLDYPLVTYVSRVIEATSLVDFAGGILKAMLFGVIVAAVGCLRGLQTGKGAGAVGVSTTSSVVSGITLIAISDGILAVLFWILEL